MLVSLLVLAVLAAALYPLRVPLVAARQTYRRQRIPAELPLISGAGIRLPPEPEARIAPLVAQLEAHGFERVTRVAPRQPGGGVSTHAHVLRDPERHTYAWVIDMQGASAVTTYVELTTEYADGVIVNTVNHASPSIFATLPRVRKTLRRGAGVDELVELHRSACAGMAAAPRDDGGADPLELAQWQNREVLEHQVERGVLARRGEDYGFSKRGALRSTLRLWRDGRRRGRG
jgi:hypothetical protein